MVHVVPDKDKICAARTSRSLVHRLGLVTLKSTQLFLCLVWPVVSQCGFVAEYVECCANAKLPYPVHSSHAPAAGVRQVARHNPLLRRVSYHFYHRRWFEVEEHLCRSTRVFRAWRVLDVHLVSH